MSLIHLKSFRAGDGIYDHYINTSIDGTVVGVYGDITRKWLYCVDSNAIVYGQDGCQLGRLQTDITGNWRFVDNREVITNFNTSDLLKAEVMLFKKLLATP